MALKFMYDAAYPSASLPHVEVAAWYIGGDTPNPQRRPFTKTPEDLPIWVRSNPGSQSQGTTEGARTVGILKSLGYSKGDTVALDYETAVDDAYLTGFDTEVVRGGFKTILYGSESTVLSNHRPSGGYWVAVWNDSPTLPGGWAAHQYANKGAFDLSVISDTVQLHGGPVGPPPPPPPPPPHAHFDFMVTRPLLSVGSREPAVGEAQLLCNYWVGTNLKPDSDFGPLTQAGIKALQNHFHMLVTGVVDQFTWKVLLTGAK